MIGEHAFEQTKKIKQVPRSRGRFSAPLPPPNNFGKKNSIKKLLFYCFHRTGTPLCPVTPEQENRRIYFEALDLIGSPIEERFDQPSFKAYCNMVSLLIGVLSSQDVCSQMDYMKENYADDVRTGYLFSQLEMKDAQIDCFADILKAVKSLTDQERNMILSFVNSCW